MPILSHSDFTVTFFAVPGPETFISDADLGTLWGPIKLLNCYTNFACICIFLECESLAFIRIAKESITLKRLGNSGLDQVSISEVGIKHFVKSEGDNLST